MSRSGTIDAAANQKTNLLKTFWFAGLTTMLIWALVGFNGGLQDFLQVVTLTVLEITFSADNAVVNCRLLRNMSHFWQSMFMTVGIVIAVFVVRFALPIFIVMMTAGLGFSDVLQMALNDPLRYAEELHSAAPLIDAFGGTFLVMIGVAFFLDHEKDVHWFAWLERRLAPLGRYDNITIFLMIGVALALCATAPSELRLPIVVASVSGIFLHLSLDLFGSIVESDDSEEDDDSTNSNAKTLGTLASIVMFLRLELVDASFSFDGVVGAFAITTSVVLIFAGLGAGAMWVRSMTVYLLRAGTLAKFKYLESGAMWAIFVLGVTMLVALYDVELPEWFTGSIGLVMISSAIVSSTISARNK